MPHVLTAREARDRFGEVLRRAETNGETFIVEKKGRPRPRGRKAAGCQRLHAVSGKDRCSAFAGRA